MDLAQEKKSFLSKFKEADSQDYLNSLKIEYLGKKSSVDWNHANKYIGDIVSSIGNVQFSANGGTTECLLPTSFVEIVESGGANYYVLNGGTTYGSDISYGLYDGTYVLKN